MVVAHYLKCLCADMKILESSHHIFVLNYVHHSLVRFTVMWLSFIISLDGSYLRTDPTHEGAVACYSYMDMCGGGIVNFT